MTIVVARKGLSFFGLRPEAGIWGGLWSLPEIEGDDAEGWCRERVADDVDAVERWGLLRHSFSHYDLDIRPIVVRVAAPLSKVADNTDATWHRLDDELPGGMAAPVNKLLEKLRNGTHG